MVTVLVLVFALQLLSSTTTLGLHTSTNAPSSSSSSSSLVNRRKLIFSGAGAATAAAAAAASCLPRRADAAVSSPFEQPSIQQSGGYSERVGGIGGGFDMLGDRKPMADIDVLYPPSLNGTWVCERKVVSVEGDTNQAQGAWKLLGGTNIIRKGGGREDFQKAEEKYFVRFVDLRRPTDGIIGLDGKKYYGDILDRGYEIEERTSRGSGSDEGTKPTEVQWDPRAPNVLNYDRNDGSPATELKVVQRKVEPQNNQGSLAGSNELIRVTTKAKAGAIFGSSFDIVYATRVQRRWRRTTTDEGDRVVEGLEIQKTYRVLDGIAGIETPTSTVKSTLRLTRTYPTRASASPFTAPQKSNNNDDDDDDDVTTVFPGV